MVWSQQALLWQKMTNVSKDPYTYWNFLANVIEKLNNELTHSLIDSSPIDYLLKEIKCQVFASNRKRTWRTRAVQKIKSKLKIHMLIGLKLFKFLQWDNHRQKKAFLRLRTLIRLLRFLSLKKKRKKTFVSSAKSTKSSFVDAFWISLTYKRNIRGPDTDPCGTPRFIVILSVLQSFSCTYWGLFDKQSLNLCRGITPKSMVLRGWQYQKL